LMNADPVVARRRVRSLAGSISANWWQSVSVSLPRSLQVPDWRYTSRGSDLRLSSFGRFVALVDGPPSGLTTGSSIRVVAEVSWTIEFSGPIAGSESSNEKTSWVIPGSSLHSTASTDENKWVWICDKGMARTMWDSIPFECVLYAVDGMSSLLFMEAEDPTKSYTKNVFWFRKSELSTGVWALVAFQTDALARSSKPNPARDRASGQVYVKPDQTAATSTTFLVLSDRPW
jgi:hypothetical protein